MRTGLSGLALLCMFVFAWSAARGDDDLPRLKVSANGRFLVQADGSGFFLLADTAWAIGWKLGRGEVERYLQHRKQQEFNAVAIVAFPGIEGELVVPNVYGDFAFEIGSHGVWDPLQPITTPGENPEDSAEYDYWDHLEYIIDTAKSKGMYVILLPAWGCYVAGDWGTGKVTRDVIFDTRSGYQYGRWIGQRLKDKTNIIWMLGGDRSAVYDGRDYRQVFHALAEGIADGVNGVDQQDREADYSTTLMSYHPRKWRPNSSEWFHNAPWLDFNSIQDQPSDQIAAITLDYGLKPAKPTWLFEGGYEYRKRIYKDWQIRFQAYQTVFAGGFGVTYGSMNVYHFDGAAAGSDEPNANKKTRAWEIGLDEPGAGDMQHLLKLMTRWSNDQFLDRIPDQSLIEGDAGGMTGDEGVRSDRIQATRGRKGDYALVYSANGRNISLRMNRLSAPRMNAYWFNPRNGKWHIHDREVTVPRPFMKNVASGRGAPVQEFDPPGEVGDGNDWVLLLKR